MTVALIAIAVAVIGGWAAILVIATNVLSKFKGVDR